MATVPFQRVHGRCRTRISSPSSPYSRYTRQCFASAPLRTNIAVHHRLLYDTQPMQQARQHGKAMQRVVVPRGIEQRNQLFRAMDSTSSSQATRVL